MVIAVEAGSGQKRRGHGRAVGHGAGETDQGDVAAAGAGRAGGTEKKGMGPAGVLHNIMHFRK